jgi:hypothetical protein
MTTSRIILSLLTVGVVGIAQAQSHIDPGVGGRIDTFDTWPTTPGSPIKPNTTAGKIAYNSNPDNVRYLDMVYALNQTNGVITWSEDLKDAGLVGHKVFKSQVSKPADSSQVARGEVSPSWDYTKTGVRWYAISVFVPYDWTMNPADTIVGQLHTSQDTIVVSPPVDLIIKDSYISLGLQTSELTDNVGSTPHLEKTTSSTQTIRLASIADGAARNKWYCFVMRADWSYTPGAGSFKLWLNGALKYEAQNAMNSYQTRLGNYAKTGLYVPATASMPASQTIYTDYVYLGSPDATQEEMLAQTPCASN